MNTIELWRDVVGYEGWYAVSNLGNVKRIRPGKATRVGRLLSKHVSRKGRLRVALTKNSKAQTLEIAPLVAAAFLGPKPVGTEINHIDFNCKNDRADNLEYITHSENIRHAYRHGFKAARGERQHLAKLKEADIRLIRNSGLGPTALSIHYRVSRTTIKAIRAKRTWKHVT